MFQNLVQDPITTSLHLFAIELSCFKLYRIIIIEELAALVQNRSNLSNRKNLDLRPYNRRPNDRLYKVLLIACAANCTTGTILAIQLALNFVYLTHSSLIGHLFLLTNEDRAIVQLNHFS